VHIFTNSFIACTCRDGASFGIVLAKIAAKPFDLAKSFLPMHAFSVKEKIARLKAS
jgi:hypothetical protein